MGKHIGLALVVASCVGTLACAHYQPVVPMRARSGDLDLELVSVRPTLARAFVYRSQSTVPHAVQHGWLTVPSRAPCTGGLEIADVIVDGNPGMGRTIEPGTHELAMRFENGIDDYSLDVVVDLQIDDGTCARAPAISQSIPLDVPARRPVLTVAAVLQANPDLWGLGSIVDWEIGAGLWLGPALVMAQIGAGGAFCTPEACGRDSHNNVRDSATFPVSLEARLPLGTLQAHTRLANGGSIGARYAYMPIRLPALDGDHRFAVHTAQGVLVWSMQDAPAGPFRHLDRVMSIELAIPLGVMVETGGPTRNVVFTGGVEVRWLSML